MDQTVLTDINHSVMEKLETRSKRVGIPMRAFTLEENEAGRSSSLYICGDEGDPRTVILRIICDNDASCSVYVREEALSRSGLPRGYSDESPLPDGWHRFSYMPFNEEAVKYISLYAADILEYEFSIFETNAEPFDCCSRQYTCSIRGECLHPDQLYAKACIYRKTLLTGNKF